MRWPRSFVPLLAGAALLLPACGNNKVLFRNQQVHARKSLATCDSGKIASLNQDVHKDNVDIYEVARGYWDIMNSCVVPGTMEQADEQDLCTYYRTFRGLTSDKGREPDEADREIEKQLRQQYEGYRKFVEDVSRSIRNGLQELQRKSPQTSMLYLLEARLYLLTGYALEHQMYLLGGYDTEAAAEWYRKVPEMADRALSTNKSYGLAYLYKAESMARLGRCPEAKVQLKKLVDNNYQTSSVYALLAYCERAEPDKAAMRPWLDKASDKADREEAAAWAYAYRRYMDERVDWQHRQSKAEAKDELEMTIDDAAPPARLDRLSLVRRLEERLDQCGIGQGGGQQ